MTATEFDRMAGSGEFMVAYPGGVNKTWNAGYRSPIEDGRPGGIARRRRSRPPPPWSRTGVGGALAANAGCH